MTDTTHASTATPEIVQPRDVVEANRSNRLRNIIAEPVARASQDPTVQALSDQPEHIEQATTAMANALATDPNFTKRLITKTITWSMVTTFATSVYLLWQSIQLQLPFDPSSFSWEPVAAAVAAAGAASIPIVKRFFPSFGDWLAGFFEKS